MKTFFLLSVSFCFYITGYSQVIDTIQQADVQNQNTQATQITVQYLEMKSNNIYFETSTATQKSEAFDNKALANITEQGKVSEMSRAIPEFKISEISYESAKSLYPTEFESIYPSSLEVPVLQVPSDDDYQILKDKKKRLRGYSQYDSRIEIAQLDPAIDWHRAIYEKAESVAMIVEKENITKLSAEFFQLDIATTLGNRYNLCDSEPFCGQVVVGTGSAFIVGEDIMITAKHVFQRPLKDYAVVFGYRVINKVGTAESSIKVNEVYYPVEMIADFDDIDLVKFKVDRKLEHPILEWEKSSKLKKGNEIYMLGYPCGLPEKLAINADIYDNSNRQYFFTYLDSYQGNSGSPVFNFETNKVIGVLVSGQLDFEYNGNCYISSLNIPEYCLGEKAMRIELAFEE